MFIYQKLLFADTGTEIQKGNKCKSNDVID